jgi:hypothetical protein
MAEQRCALAEESVINMIDLLLSFSNWPIIMIGPGGILLVVPPVSVLWGGLQKSRLDNYT